MFLLLMLMPYQFAKAAVSLQYINALYLNGNCEYFSETLKKNWISIPESEKNQLVAKLADCAVERGQHDFAESLFKNLDEKNFSSSLLIQAKTKLDIARNDYNKIIDYYEMNQPTKGTFFYYIYVAQSYYETENYDESIKVLSFISPGKLTQYQKNLIRYWKAKNFFLKDDYNESKYFIDLILDSEDTSWLIEATRALRKSVEEKHKMFRASIYTSAYYDDNANRESLHDVISNNKRSASYKRDGVYKFNPSFDFFLVKNKKHKKYINLDVNLYWSSAIRENESESYSLKYRHSNKLNVYNTFTWDIGFTKSQSQFKDSANDVHIRGSLFHLVNSSKFLTASFKYTRDTLVPSRYNYNLSLSYFKLFGTQLIYGTLSRGSYNNIEADYTYNGITAPLPSYGTMFSNYNTTGLDLAHSYEFNDKTSLRTQASYTLIDYQNENLPAGTSSYTNSTEQRHDSKLTGTLTLSRKTSENSNFELFISGTQGSSTGFQGYYYTDFVNKNYTANQVGINYDWTFE